MNNTLMLNDMVTAMLMPIFMIGILIILQVFWFFMLLDVTTSKKLVGIDKLTWVIVVILTNWLGAGIYFFAGRPEQDLKKDNKEKRPLPKPEPLKRSFSCESCTNELFVTTEKNIQCTQCGKINTVPNNN